MVCARFPQDVLLQQAGLLDGPAGLDELIVLGAEVVEERIGSDQIIPVSCEEGASAC